MRAYFTQIGVVTLASRLLGKNLIDSYAFHGTLPRFQTASIEEISETEGIDNVPLKANDFQFGNLCGTVIEKYIDTSDRKALIYQDACIMKNLFFDVSAKNKYTDEELKAHLETIFRALTKRAQIRTHTNKPGSEDIHSWLTDFYKLQKEYEVFVAELIEILVSPDINSEKKYTADLFDQNDKIIALALKDTPVSSEVLADAVIENASSKIGEILCEIVGKTMKTT